jgi:hypothetical protein
MVFDISCFFLPLPSVKEVAVVFPIVVLVFDVLGSRLKDRDSILRYALILFWFSLFLSGECHLMRSVFISQSSTYHNW